MVHGFAIEMVDGSGSDRVIVMTAVFGVVSGHVAECCPMSCAGPGAVILGAFAFLV